MLMRCKQATVAAKGLIALFVSLLVLGGSQVCAQQTTDAVEWHKLGDGKFTVHMPGKPDHESLAPDVSPAYDAYRLSARDVDYLLLIRSLDVRRDPKSLRELSLKGHAIGYTSGLIDEDIKQGIKISVVFDRDLSLNGFPGKQYRIISKECTG